MDHGYHLQLERSRRLPAMSSDGDKFDDNDLPDLVHAMFGSRSPRAASPAVEHIQLVKTSRNNNPSGRNGLKPRPLIDDEMEQVIRTSWAQGETLFGDVNAELRKLSGDRSFGSKKSYKRSLHDRGIGIKVSQASRSAVSQAVLLKMEGDLGRATGIRGMTHKLRSDGLVVSRESVQTALQIYDANGIASRTPGSKQVKRFPINMSGPDEQWSGDGHDKLCSILGLGIYGWRDVWSGAYIALRVFPLNRTEANVHWFFLDTCVKRGGYPLVTATDRGSEVSDQASTQMAFRETFSDPAFNDILPAHIFLASPRNITIERGWREVRENVVDHIKILWAQGSDRYNAHSEVDGVVALWLFPPLVQIALDKFVVYFNTRPVRHQAKKLGPSGKSRHRMYNSPELFHSRHCLQEFGERQAEVERLRDVAEESASLEYVVPAIAEVCARGLASLGEREPEEWTDATWDLFARLVLVVRAQLTPMLQQ